MKKILSVSKQELQRRIEEENSATSQIRDKKVPNWMGF
jgi:hypothetical protein